MKNNFLILAHARSGSTTLAEIFESQNQTVSFEPFNAHNHRGINYLDHWGKEGFESAFDLILASYNGIKHLYSFTNFDQTKYMKSKCNTIFLYRNNLLDAALSLELAFKTNVWMKAQKNHEYLKEKVNIKIEKIQGAISNLRTHLKNLDDTCYKISYEDLYGLNGFDIIKEIFKFTNCPIKNESLIHELLNKKNKLNNRSWCEVIGNWDEIASINFGNTVFMD